MSAGLLIPLLLVVVAIGGAVFAIASGIHEKQVVRDSLRSLGLKRIGDVVVKEDRPEIRGMVNTVTHLVKVEEVD